MANASAAVEEAEELKIALSSMDARLAEFQRKDVEVYSRIKEAMESSEAARLANEYLHGRDVVLSKEVKNPWEMCFTPRIFHEYLQIP